MVVSPNQAPDLKDVEDALRALNVSRIREGRAHVATDETDRNDPLDFGRDFAPSIVPPDETAQIGTEELASKASLGKRLAGATIGSIIIAIVVAFAWQGSYSKKSKPSSDLAVSVSPSIVGSNNTSNSAGADTGRSGSVSRANFSNCRIL